MNMTLRALLGATALLTLTGLAQAAVTEITVATVNNGDMVRMQGLMDDFYAKHPDIKVELGDAGRERAAPERHHRHRHRRRSV